MIALQQKAIICVSKNIHHLKAIEKILSDNFGKSFVVEIAESSIEVLNIITTLEGIGIQTSVVIVDYQISDMTGLEFIHQINRRYTQIKSMLMTEEADINFAQKLVNQNSVYALVKLPLNKNHFIQLVGNACQQYGTDIELEKMVTRLRLSEEEKSLILESMTESIIYMDMNREILWNNTVAERELFDASHSDAENIVLLQTICDRAGYDEIINNGVPYTIEIPLGKRWMSVRFFPAYDKDRLPIGMVMTILDITERARALKMNESLLDMSRFINRGDSMVMIYNKAFHLINKYFDVQLMCMTGEDFDSNYVEYYGEGFEEIEQDKVQAFIHSAKQVLKHHKKEELVLLKNDSETMLAYPMNEKILLLVIGEVLSKNSDGVRYMNIIAEHVKLGIMKIDSYRKSVYQANHDNLTGLFSRSYFFDRLKNHFNNQRKDWKEPGFYSLAVLDLNFFKDVNDNLSHLVGDEVLLEIAQRLRRASREGDVVARVGGDEFAILFQTGNRIEIKGLIERLQQEISEPINVEEIGIRIGSSFGIVHDISQYDRVEQLMGDADQAMYEAKKDKGGIGTYVFFEKNIQNRVDRYNLIGGLLKNADFDAELSLDYQPIIRLKDLDVVGYEGFLRWHSKGNGSINPEEFIPIAESNGKMSRIGDKVIEIAIEDIKKIVGTEDHQRFITINMSPDQLADDAHVLKMKKRIISSEINGSQLHIDLHDRFRENQVQKISRNVNALRDFGVTVDLDDFGTSDSVISTIGRFKIDEVKIDRETVSTFRFNDEAKMMIKSVISIARSLDMKVTAEGVEKKEELDGLIELGCDYAQGYYFMRPGNIEKAMAYKI